jgi:hypothetical protein
MNLYYAHFIGIYNTKQEQRDMEMLQNIFPNYIIINPNIEEHQIGCKENGMKYFEDIVKDCDLLVFRGCVNGKIPAGVHKEVQCAKNNNIPIIELPCLINRAMSVDDTREMLMELGVR